jgi:hypothetical protein
MTINFAGSNRDNPTRPATDWLVPGAEPKLHEVFADPIVHAVMRRDGVSPTQLRAIVARAQACLRGDPCCRCAA